MNETSVHQRPPIGYKQTDLGLLPNTWDAVLLGDLFIIQERSKQSQAFLRYWDPHRQLHGRF